MLIFKNVYSRKSNTYYDVWVNVVDKKIVAWNCSCIFGSWFRWGGYWRKKGTYCKHVKDLIRTLKKLGAIDEK